MTEHPEFDLVSIGGGFAGLVAALRGAELGLRTEILEQGTDERYLCSSRWAGGIFHVSYHDVKLAPAELVGAIEQVELAAGLAAHAFEHDRAEGAAAAAERHRDHRRRQHHDER